MTRAVMADELGPPETYSLRDYDPGPPGPGQVRVAIRAAGVSFVDVLNATGKYQGRTGLPFIPGSEFSGVVEALGEGVSTLEPGQGVLGTAWGGAMADVINVEAKALCPMPESMSFNQGAVFKISALTAWHALVDRAQIAPGETLLVLGAGGGTGTAAVQLGRELGARVIASASSAEKRALAEECGAHAVVDTLSDNWRHDVATASQAKAVDVVFDPVGGEYTERAFRSLGYRGRHLVVGFAAGIAQLPTNLPLLKDASLIGVNLQAVAVHQPEHGQAQVKQVLRLGAQGKLLPVIERSLPLASFAEAMYLVSEGRTIGRLVLTMD
ncbi:NADPH:quinone oxidoreductase family protein [Mangrovimicrobium sediminis]|uniref:NADPH:quinone oxidoreductase family protein n=1 Tax=Mangrovimicrobium sediminis TaxID=2562682 RepID=A0A4Z0LV49_9GAMM|nr:NADPH:quinone oxidoreductase family protein [Haliea sp. SAOS-164]TGD70998.1 NADPH:quinone oxidoreductase family protein [Haliea sp. SAOS-164]